MKHINPANLQKREIKESPIQAIKDIVLKAREAQKVWRERPISERIRLFRPLGQILKTNKERIARIITNDMGKPLWAAKEEVDWVVEEINFYLKNALLWLKPEKIDRATVVFEPLGVVAVISPWNFPLGTSMISVIPALISGNSVILKPSEYSPFCGKEIERLINMLNLPQYVFSLIIGGKSHGRKLVNQAIDMVCFTGSRESGKEVMRRSAQQIHRLILELGGLDAAIVFKDVNIKKVAKEIVQRNTFNSGQVCCAIKRVYVEREIYDQFIKYAVEEAKKIKVGNPMEDVDMGPLVARFQLKKIEEMLKDAINKGAKIIFGGKRLKQKGYFFPPTIVVNVNHQMRLMKEEPFGPVLPIFKIKDWQEGVRLANSTRYGLTGSVWTKNIKLARKIAQMLEVGVAGINSHGGGPLGSPWGGAKESGLGRLNGKEGLRAFCNVKVIVQGVF